MRERSLELLLPGAPPDGALQRRAARAVQLARMLYDLGRGPRADVVDLDLAQAEAAYAAHLGAEALDLCEGLFGAYLDEAAGCVAPWPGRRGPARELWGGLVALAERAPDLALPSLPDPEESRGDVARRVLVAATCLGLAPGRVELWRAHLERAEGDPGGAEQRLDELLGHGDPGLRVAALELALGVRLERGAPGRAQGLVEANLDLVAADDGLRRVAAWVCASAGDLELARELAVPTPAAELPAVVAALGLRCPGLREVLCGGRTWELPPQAPGGGGPATQPRPRTPRLAGRRREIGAGLVAVFRLAEQGAELVHLEQAPGVAGATRDWLADRRFAAWDAGELEHHALGTGGGLVALAGEDPGTAPGAPGLAAWSRRVERSCRLSACAGVALVPVGPGAAWVRLEFEHRLLPEDRRLVAFAEALARRLGLDAAGLGVVVGDPRPAADELAELLAPVLATGTPRAWWCLSHDEPPLQLAHGGAADPAELAGLVRPGLGAPQGPADRTLGVGEAGVGPGLVLGLGPAWSPAAGSLVVATARALRPRQVAAWRRAAQAAAPAYLLLAFRAWLRARSERDVHLDPALLDPPGRPLGGPGDLGLGTGELLGALVERPRRVVLLTGRPSSGRRLGAHLAQFLDAGSTLGSPAAGRSVRGLDGPGLVALLERPGALLLEDLEDLAGQPELEAVLLRGLDQAAAGDRSGPLLLVAGEELLAGDSGLWPKLGRRLRTLELRLAPLSQRRRELAGILRALLRREASARRLVPPVLEPGAQALVWRQDWDLAGLAELARRLVALGAGQELTAADVEAQLGPATGLRRGMRGRLASKRPDLRSLWAALDATRKGSGGFHRGRAGALLGWDPATVSARIRDLGLEDLG